ncbi:MAG: DNA methyltransferase [Solirubrobacteraceae bacterium]
MLAARRAAESASRAALDGLGVFLRDKPGHLDADQAALRNGLRAKWRQLGEDRDLLVAECAYEQWHRLLFARFLAENNLLLHPEYKAPVTLADCDELAAELGEPDGWSVAARFAAEIVPGIFRLDDPCFRLRLAPEGRDALEQILDGLPHDVFVADDALGWVYQFWQKDKKDEVNASGRKIGGADLGPVTQLFTENYMVRFLLENSLGAWWAAQHPGSPLVKGFDYLRVDDDGRTASGSFDGWPDRVAEVTVMDPCCGSGHFLVEAFLMLWQMRAEEERLTLVDAQDAVLRDNLFGLELDPRCVQIAMFAIALQAWKTGGGWRQLPVPNIACSGMPVKAPAEEWKALASGDERLENALARLNSLFSDADTLGSLIDPRRTAEAAGSEVSLDDVEWNRVAPLLEAAVAREATDSAATVVRVDAAGLAHAADLLARSYVLIVTNPPFLSRGKQAEPLRRYAALHHGNAKADLATTFQSRFVNLTAPNGCIASVAPQAFLMQPRYRGFRTQWLDLTTWRLIARLGDGAFSAFGGAVVNVLLGIWEVSRAGSSHKISVIDAQSSVPSEKASTIQVGPVTQVSQSEQRNHPAGVATLEGWSDLPLLEQYADGLGGITTGDSPKFRRFHWEFPQIVGGWVRQQGTPPATAPFTGRDSVLLWEGGKGELMDAAAHGRATIAGRAAWARKGVAVQKMGELPVTLYGGEQFENVGVVISPHKEAHLSAIWHFAASGELAHEIRAIDQSVGVTCNTMVKVPFDLRRWQKVAEEAGPLPEPWSDDPTQWLFEGRPEVSTAPLQVAVARLLGYCWPGQAGPDDLERFADQDGIVCLPSVAGEPPAAERMQQLLLAAFGEAWSIGKVRELLDQTGSNRRTLADWLRDEFFKQHCALFGNRPFVWQVWDGLRDGFSALVNYHRLDRRALEKLAYTYLGQDWIERQRAAARDDVPGAGTRLSAARDLQRKLEAILEGEKPCDIYVRWKALHEQPVGWEPDLNDGVRLNIRPFVEAGVLRSPFNVHWKKDRGKNPDGSERRNDIHLSLAEKQAARERAGRT